MYRTALDYELYDYIKDIERELYDEWTDMVGKTHKEKIWTVQEWVNTPDFREYCENLALLDPDFVYSEFKTLKEKYYEPTV